jgi:transcription antitermination factor NusG
MSAAGALVTLDAPVNDGIAVTCRSTPAGSEIVSCEHGHASSVHRPLFTGYVFAAMTDADPWTPVRYCPGVRAILGLEVGRPRYAHACGRYLLAMKLDPETRRFEFEVRRKQ